MNELPVQPTAEELEQFPEAPKPVEFKEDNTEGVDENDLAKLSGSEVDPDGEGEVHV